MLQHTALCPHGSECLYVRGSRSWSPVEYQRSCGGSCKYATIRSSRGTTEIHVNLLQLSSKHIHAFQEACDTYRGVFPRVQRTIIIAITVRRGGGYRRRESGAGIYRTAPTRLNEHAHSAFVPFYRFGMHASRDWRNAAQSSLERPTTAYCVHARSRSARFLHRPLSSTLCMHLCKNKAKKYELTFRLYAPEALALLGTEIERLETERQNH